MPGLAHPFQHQRVGLRLLRRQENASQSTVEFRQPAQRFAMVENALCIQRGKDGGMTGHGDGTQSGDDGEVEDSTRPRTTAAMPRYHRFLLSTG